MSNERSKNISNFKNFNSKTPEKFSSVTLVTNFHKLSLWSDPDNNFWKTKIDLKFWILLLFTYNKPYFHSLHKRFKCTASEYRELNFYHKFYPFIQFWVPRNVGVLCSTVPGTFLCNLGTNYAMVTP